ncbi:Phage regulatory protein Rha (Phage_pRha) [Desulfitobacterium dehalogenans ATCC 51507]|uniref:Phage regulatory protein Rha (Phage_pRha) n=1 Tax=Desulfitobacterium dehalogenans (strain ATCC 51507 / DSM 9161 / JW/IU-DC1) TaxID=756499 RepID=I4A6E0_DESDJ|nr:Rha family transcriptional regulator [Desulfitobacterium dehalogenans]AFL99524.1 Phage regulatory protein Rha (Phage_pRha) [Desulfitobacterium dehalogenans ATCC 51507]
MNELVIIKGNEVKTNSIIVAEGTGNAHESIVRMVRRYEDQFKLLGKLEYSDYLKSNSLGSSGRMYLLNEQQATFLMTLLSNKEMIVRFKLRLTQEFFRMREFIREKQSAEWKQARITGKQVRREETDVILTKLIPLAESQGSKNAGKLYMNYSKLVNITLGIEAGRRENLPLSYIEAIKFLERAIENIISQEVDKGTHYKEIYQVCKAKCQIIKDLAFLPSLKLIS